MADVIKKATRESYGEALAELSEKYSDLIVVDADLALELMKARNNAIRRIKNKR